MTQKKYNHVHKLRRDRYSTGRAFYYCTNDCRFKIDVKHSLGMTVLCNKCGNPFVMNEYSIRASKPICMDCVDRKTSAVKFNIDSLMGEMNTNHVDRISEPARSEIKISTNPIEELQNKMRNILVKEYNPEDEDDVL